MKFLFAGERILQRLEAAEVAAGGNAFHCGEPAVVRQQLDSVRQAHHNLLQLWHRKKVQLDQCFQLRLFEQDCEKVRNHYPSFLINFFIIYSNVL